LKIIFIGAPGSGKGTQSREFIDKYGYVQLSTGDLLRAAISQSTDLGLLAKSFMDQGKLVPDVVMIDLVKTYLSKQSDKSVILDGFPRTVAQAESLDNMLKSNNDIIDRVIYFKINPQILVERLTGRRTCSSCSEIYHIKTKPSKASEVCDKCGGKVIQRPDDKEDVIVERLAQFEKNTGPTIEYYRSKNVLFEIDGAQEPSIVFEQIQKSLSLLN
jgi:adenylate kinase